MQEKIKNVVITISFVFILFAVFFGNIIAKDKEISLAERRKLASFPKEKLSIENALDGSLKTSFEKYIEDQFIGRDIFRNIKTFFALNIYNHKDIDGLYAQNGAIYKIEYPLNENNVEKSAKKIKNVYDTFLKGKNMNVYYSIVPDKNYYLPADYLKLDISKMEEIFGKELTDLKYIDIKDSLKLEDYYNTDLHWKQENLEEVANTLKKNMNLKIEESKYEKIDKGNFYGIYYGQLEAKVDSDTIYILNNKVIEECTTYNYETGKTAKVYDEKNTNDKYDIYLSGATPLLTIENPNATTEKELLLFRDSFGSSLAPLLIENYSKITLIDIRYMSVELLDDYIEFENQDVLFLYNTLILNQYVFKR